MVVLLIGCVQQMDGDGGSTTRKGRSNREAQAAAELKKLKGKRTAAVPELQSVMEVSSRPDTRLPSFREGNS